MADEHEEPAAKVCEGDRAASGAPVSGWATGDRFSWEEIHQRLLASADAEISHSFRELFFSGVSAGFAIVLTFIGSVVGHTYYPDNTFLSQLLYPIGFMYIILGRYQLYTENTLPPVELVMTRLASLPLLLRLWAVVLVANLLGTAFGAFILANTEVLPPEAIEAGVKIVEEDFALPWWDVFFKALFAGWIVAGVVWLTDAATDTISRVVLTYIAFYMLAATGLLHVITTACEVLYVLFSDASSPGLIALFRDLWLPVLLGNTAGGVLLFTFVSYAQSAQQRFPGLRVLSLRETFFSMKGGRPFGPPRPPWKQQHEEQDKSDQAGDDDRAEHTGSTNT